MQCLATLLIKMRLQAIIIHCSVKKKLPLNVSEYHISISQHGEITS